MRRPRFARIVDLPSAELESGARPRVVANRNGLIASYPFVDGVKTGYTGLAGNVLIGSGSGRGARVISVVMGEPSEAARDADTLALLRYGLARFVRRRPLDEDRVVARVDVAYHDSSAPLVPAKGLNVTLRRGERVRRTVDAPEELDGPLDAGTRVGRVAVFRGDELVGRVPLVTAGEVPGASMPRKVLSALGVPVFVLFVLTACAAAALRLRAVQRGRGRAKR
jgi:D-alanyl-D-alanine carboxypeptidase (penicillin-binding protein 5/6)